MLLDAVFHEQLVLLLLAQEGVLWHQMVQSDVDLDVLEWEDLHLDVKLLVLFLLFPRHGSHFIDNDNHAIAIVVESALLNGVHHIGINFHIVAAPEHDEAIDVAGFAGIRCILDLVVVGGGVSVLRLLGIRLLICSIATGGCILDGDLIVVIGFALPLVDVIEVLDLPP